MNNMEERLWNYIDGSCTASEQEAIALLIAQDAAWRNAHQELLNFDAELLTIDADEPPMAFTYQVMEAIGAEHTMQPLKANIDKRIIIGIASFFVLTILLLVIYTLSTLHFSGAGSVVNFPVNLKMPDITSYFSGPVIKGFLFFDVVLGLFLADAFLRKRIVVK